MHQGLEYILLLCFFISWVHVCDQSTTNATGVCTKKPLKCCMNYRRVGDTCEECFPGSFGENCNKTCPDGFYGILCGENCNNCSNCHKIHGCTENSTLEEQPPENDENIDWHIVTMFVSGSAGLCFVIGFALYNKLRKLKKHQRNPQGNNDVPDSNGQPQLNPSTSTMIAGEYIENFPISKEQHQLSKCHRLSETFSSDRCVPNEVAFEDGCISQDASENVYSHLNMDAMSYNTLNHISDSEKEPVIGMYSTSSQEVTSTENSISDKTESKSTSRRSFLHPVVVLSKGDENAMTKDDRKQINNTTLKNTTEATKSEATKSNIQNSEKLLTSLTKKVRTPSKREKLEKKMHVDEMSKMLEDFKPKTEELENNNSKASLLYRSSKKTKRKLLRYSFAPSTEIA